MKPRWITWILTAMIFTGTFSGSALAGNAPRGMAPTCADIVLTVEQKKQLLVARVRFNVKFIDLWAELAKAENQEERIMDADVIDFQALKEAVRTTCKADEKIELAMIDGLSEIQDILTEEQWRNYLCLMQTEASDDMDEPLSPEDHSNHLTGQEEYWPEQPGAILMEESPFDLLPIQNW